MFKKIDIKLTEPICNCEENKLSWNIWIDEKNKPGLEIICNDCKTKLKIPTAKFVATFILDKEYPGKKPEKTEPKLTVLDGGKVIEFKKEKEEVNDH